METVILVFVGISFACCLFCLFRIIRGPTAPDRTVAIDMLGIVIVCFCALMAVLTKKDFFINAALVWSLVSFIGTLALAKFLEGRGLDE
jgi:multicomponent Na+:H+ antiporter subunit F